MGYADGCPAATQRPCRSSNGCLFLQHSTDVIYDMPAFGGAHINGINRHHRTAEGHHAENVTIRVVFGIPGMHITARGQIPGFQNQFSPNQPIASTGLTVTRNAINPKQTTTHVDRFFICWNAASLSLTSIEDVAVPGTGTERFGKGFMPGLAGSTLS